MKPTEWLMLNFSLPKQPSRVRVGVWRKLKKAGAANIGQSLWLLPPMEPHRTVFDEIADDILKNGGEVYLMSAVFLDTGTSGDVSEIFDRDRDEEYKEFLDACEDFFRELEKETAAGNFTFAEIEENESEFGRLEEWLKKIVARDFFTAPLKTASVEALSRCGQMLADYSETVYRLNTEE